MAIKLIANYSKRLGLPGYSSHQFSVSVETELVTTDDVAGESERLYHLLQSHVDGQITRTGFVPPADYGMEQPVLNPTTRGTPREAAWKCSDKQRSLILSIIDEHKLDKNRIEALANQRFGKGVRLLNKVEASGLIDELLETHGGQNRHDGGNARRGGTAYRRNSQRKEAA
ncbi:hypothetical protein JIN84_21835 [Luteolibacter yonseiensis]|uniref:Uncharacterized protein n=1 Tax=Luteolibacter yonseiensis TaxID=1144680 RepID=A0A934R9A5_9BACT|nr:hypothetical protein [Luteolibacter yonseiensis]MBK1818278.1 hypothetical protein [Luteolibacter yonseiensis]